MARPGMRLAFGAAATERCGLTFRPERRYIFKTMARFAHKCCVFLCAALAALFLPPPSSFFFPLPGNLASFFLLYKLRPAPDKRFGRRRAGLLLIDKTISNPSGRPNLLCHRHARLQDGQYAQEPSFLFSFFSFFF